MYCSLVALSSPIPFLSTKAQYIKSNRCRVIVLCLLHPYLVSVLFLASSLHVNYFFRKFFITSYIIGFSTFCMYYTRMMLCGPNLKLCHCVVLLIAVCVLCGRSQPLQCIIPSNASNVTVDIIKRSVLYLTPTSTVVAGSTVTYKAEYNLTELLTRLHQSNISANIALKIRAIH